MVPYHIKESDLEGFEILMKQSWDWIYIKIRRIHRILLNSQPDGDDNDDSDGDK